jgi:hypothetical protein
MNEQGVVYFNLPANRYALLAPAIGMIVLQHVQAVRSRRQIDRAAYDQTPFAVCVDELNRFALPELVPSLAMLRDAHVQRPASSPLGGGPRGFRTRHSTEIPASLRAGTRRARQSTGFSAA